MPINEKINHMMHKPRDEKEVHRWLFSLTPLGVAFAFFFLLLLPMEIGHKDMIMVIGLAAGFSGLQSYWVFRGWQREEGLTVLLGIVGIIFALLFVWAYAAVLGDVLPAVFRSWVR
ncbi:MAG: hypothetical protein PVF07_08350 [Thiogranum sp.]|jgi:inner membrane protein involved in colicin E2 resistance